MTDTSTDLTDTIVETIHTRLDVSALVSAAQTALEVPPAPKDPKVYEVPDASAPAVNALIARQAELEQIAKAALSERDQIKDALKVIMGDAESLVVHGAEVATYKTSNARIVNQSLIKSMFPDVPGNEEFWTDSPRRTFNFR